MELCFRRKNNMMTNTLVRNSVVAFFLLATSTLWTHTTYGQGVIEQGPSDRWRSSLFLYLWATSLNGTAAIAGNEVDIDESFSDLADNLAGAISLRFESHKGKWGYFLDGMYVKLDPSVDTPAGTITTDVKDLVLEAGGVYHFNQTVQGLFGARYQDMELDIGFPRGMSVGGSQDWVDGFLGLRLVPVNTEKWRVWLRGDVGVVGDSDTTWNAAVGAGYLFNPRWSLVLAYRVLSNDYEDENAGFKWDVKHSGLGLALGYTFQ